MKGMTLIDTREMLHCTVLSGPYPDYPDYPPPAMLSQCYQANNKQWHSAHTSSAQPSPPPPPSWAGTWTWNLITWTLSIQCASAVLLELVCVADMSPMFVQNIFTYRWFCQQKYLLKPTVTVLAKNSLLLTNIIKHRLNVWSVWGERNYGNVLSVCACSVEPCALVSIFGCMSRD